MNTPAPFIYPPDPFPAETLKDNECTIGTPLYDGRTQYEIFQFGTRGPDRLKLVTVSHIGQLDGEVEATLYFVRMDLNRTIAMANWTMNPEDQPRFIVHDRDISVKEAHKFLIHFHLKEGQKAPEGYLYTLISSSF